MTNKKGTRRPPHIDKALKEIRSFARAEMAKNQIVQFRVDEADFERLVKMATEKEYPIGTMVRNWVFERLSLEEQSGVQVANKSKKPGAITYDQILPTLDEIKKRMTVCENAIEKLEKPKKK